jgi:Protein phosphatase 2C
MSADAPEPAANQTPGGWLALTATHRGSAHQMNGLPNQDAVAARQIQPDGLVAAVADGHGHHRHFRSGRGSELAVAIACQAAEELAARLDDFEAAAQIESDVLSTLVPAITSRWRAAARDDLAEEPFTIAEEEARAFGDDPLIAYGTTLLLAITWRNWLVLTQIGDGDIVCIRPDGQALLPVPGDPSLDGRQTTSLCGPRAEQEFRAAAVNTAITPLLGVLLATDGYGNAQVADPWPDAVGSDLAELIGDSQPQRLAEQVPLWASHCASAEGSADDTTIALLIAPAAAALLQEETRRQQQATVPPAGQSPAGAAGAAAESTAPAVADTPAAQEERPANSAAPGHAEAPAAAGGDVEAPGVAAAGGDEQVSPPAGAGGDAEAPRPAPAGRQRRFAVIRAVLRPGRRGSGGAGGD